MRKLAALWLVVVGALALAPSALAAGGAELGLIRLSSKLVASVATVDGDGGMPTTLLPVAGQHGPQPFPLSSLTWSGDGRYLITTGSEAGPEPKRPSAVGLYAIPAEGGAPVAIAGTSGGLFPVGFPDGDTVAFVRILGTNSETVSGKHVIKRTRSRYSIWLASLDGGAARRLTPWRSEGSETPTSVSPDGTTLVVRRLVVDRSRRKPPRSHEQTVLLNLRTGKRTPLGRRVADAIFSPDGARLAIVKEHRFARPHERKTKSGTIRTYGETDIYVKDRLTGALTKVTSGPARDGDPAWDPSGQRLAFVRAGGGRSEASLLFGIDDSIYEVNADGSCLTRVLHQAGSAFLTAVWRPGPERAAGPIACRPPGQ